MNGEDLVQRVLALPDGAAQEQLLVEHADLLDDRAAAALKKQADGFLRADIRRSLAAAGLLLTMADLTANPLHRAQGLLAKANALSIGLGEYEPALALYDEAAGLYAAAGRRVDRARSQIGKIGALAYLGRYAEAFEAGRWAGQILEEEGEWQILATLTLNLATAHGRAGDDVRSLALYDRAQAIYERIGAQGEPPWLWVQSNRAVALRNLGRFQESIQASQTAWEGQVRLGQTIAAARAQQALALTYLVVGRTNEALAHLDQVGDAFLADGRQRDAVLVELFVSDCLLRLRRFEDVLHKCERVRGLFAALGSDHIAAQAILNEAAALAELGRAEEALASAAEARRIFEADGNRAWAALADLQRAAVLLRQGQAEESLALAGACAACLEEHDLALAAAQAHLAAARAALAVGRPGEARALASRALEVGERRAVPAVRMQAQHLLGALAAAEGDRAAALAAYERAIRDMEQLRGQLMVEFRAGFVEDKEQIVQDAVGLCLEMGEAERGLEYAERAKSRALLEMVAERLDLGIQVRAEADRPLVEELVGLRERRNRLCRRWAGEAEGHDGEAQAAAQQEVVELEGRITGLWHRLLIRNADYAREAMLHTVRTEPAQPYLDPDTALIEYFAVHGQVVAFVVTAGGVRAVRLEGEMGQIQELTQRLWLNLKAVPHAGPQAVRALTANARGLLGRLHEALLAPLQEMPAGCRRLIVVPHGPLHYVPFHALHDGRTYLVERAEVSYLPGASFLRHCAEARPAAAGVVAVGHSAAGRLPNAVAEARQVAELLGGQAVVEEEATVERVQRAAAEVRTVHLAAHGDFRPDNPLFSGLSLADGWLTTMDVFNMRLRASLVTLSACQTGRTLVGGGDELLGLMRAFLGAGAAAVVLSLWAVEDRSTAQLMGRFYEKLAGGWSKGAALRAAQVEFLRAGDEGDGAGRAHPYYWAPFFLVGNAGVL